MALFFQLLFLWACLTSALADSTIPRTWKHTIRGPELLRPEDVRSAPEPALVHSLAVTDFRSGLKTRTRQSPSETGRPCYRSEISSWQITTTLKVRAPQITGAMGRLVPNPRWAPIETFACRENDPYFATYASSLERAKYVARGRDVWIRDLFREIAPTLQGACHPTEAQADAALHQLLDSFEKQLSDAEKNHHGEIEHEHQFLAEGFSQKTRRRCRPESRDYLAEKIPSYATQPAAWKVEAQGDRVVALSLPAPHRDRYTFERGRLLQSERRLASGLLERTEYGPVGAPEWREQISPNGSKESVQWVDSLGRWGELAPFKNLLTQASDRKGDSAPGLAVVSLQDYTRAWADSIFAAGIAGLAGAPSVTHVLPGIHTTAPVVLFARGTATTICDSVQKVAGTALIVLPAGDDGNDLTDVPSHAVHCPRGNQAAIITVGAWEHSQQGPADFGPGRASSYSPTHVDLLVPSGWERAPLPGGISVSRGSTLVAAAQIAGFAAHYAKDHPGVAPLQLRQAVMKKCKKNPRAQPYVKDSCVWTR